MRRSDGELLAYLDGEGTPGGRRRIEEDLAASPEDAARLDALRFQSRRITAALEELDVEVPRTGMPERLREAARAAPRPIGSAPSIRRASRVGGRSVATAAALILVLAAGAYAVPGSPFRGFVSRSVEAFASLLGGEAQGPADPGPSDVAVDPVEGRVHISITGPGERLRVTVAAGEGHRAHVSARVARFEVQAGRIDVLDAAGDVRVVVPRIATDVVIEVDGTIVARGAGRSLELTPAAEDGAAEILLEPAG